MFPEINDDNLEKALQKTLEEKDIRSFRQAARDAMEEAKKEKPYRPGLSPVFVAVQIAASILVVIAAIWWWQSAKSGASPDQLATAYLTEADPGISALDLGIRDETDTALVALFKQVAPGWKALDSLYSAGDYRAAMAQLDQLGSQDAAFVTFPEAEWLFYTGMCQLHLGETEAALRTLEQVKSPFLEKATFFRAIALLKLDRKEEAKPLLESIVGASAHPYKAQAIRLLEKF